MRISDWSSDVCSSDLIGDDEVAVRVFKPHVAHIGEQPQAPDAHLDLAADLPGHGDRDVLMAIELLQCPSVQPDAGRSAGNLDHATDVAEVRATGAGGLSIARSEEETSELQSLMRNSY